MTALRLPTYEDVRAAAARIDGHAHRTPVLTSRTADAELGARVFFKCESHKLLGESKFRGAFNALWRFDKTPPHGCVITLTSGNCGQAAASAPPLPGMPKGSLL